MRLVLDIIVRGYLLILLHSHAELLIKKVSYIQGEF